MMDIFKFGQGATAVSPLPRNASQFEVTLVSQTTPERLSAMDSTCKRWVGPIAVVLYLAPPLLRGEMPDTFPTAATLRKKIPFCASDERDDTVTVVVMQGLYPSAYPINRLRNLAILQVQTSHFFFNDVDFLPSKGLHQHIGRFASTLLADSNMAVVVPAFQYGRTSRPMKQGVEKTPFTLVELRDCVFNNQRDCTQFDRTTNPKGHATTGYNTWFTQKAKDLRKIVCLESTRYEPFVVLRTGGDTPRYNEDFLGYGKNKISYTRHLAHAGFQFYVLPKGFVVHAPHAESTSKAEWNRKAGGGTSDRIKNDRLFNRMEDALQAHYTDDHASWRKDAQPIALCRKDDSASWRKGKAE
jgi:glycosyltransferase-like protein LARGE